VKTSSRLKLCISGPAPARERMAAWLGPRHGRIAVSDQTDGYRGDEPLDVRRDALIAACETFGLDYAIPPEGFAGTSLRLVAFDMDSTLITIECVDELADFAERKSEVAAITAASMRGEISDFRESLTRRVALLRGLDASVLERVYEERLELSPGVETLVAGLRGAGLKTLLVSGGFTFFTDRLKTRLGLDYSQANTLEIIGGKLTGGLIGPIIDADAKAAALSATCAQLGAPAGAAVAVGDGANDLRMMALAGLSVAYRAKPVVQRAADASIAHCGLDVLLDWIRAVV